MVLVDINAALFYIFFIGMLMMSAYCSRWRRYFELGMKLQSPPALPIIGNCLQFLLMIYANFSMNVRNSHVIMVQLHNCRWVLFWYKYLQMQIVLKMWLKMKHFVGRVTWSGNHWNNTSEMDCSTVMERNGEDIVK